MSIAENLSDTLSFESIVMFVFGLGTVGLFALFILLITCYNCICHEDVEIDVLNLPHNTENGNPLSLKENPTKTKWLMMKRRDNENENQLMEIA